MGTMFALDLRLSFLGKHTLFRPPMGPVFRWMGGIPVDRTRPHAVVCEALQAFRAVERDRLLLADRPRGHAQAGWSISGRASCHIARGARVPLLLASFDWDRRSVRRVFLGPPFEHPERRHCRRISRRIEAYYAPIRGKLPASPIREQRWCRDAPKMPRRDARVHLRAVRAAKLLNAKRHRGWHDCCNVGQASKPRADVSPPRAVCPAGIPGGAFSLSHNPGTFRINTHIDGPRRNPRLPPRAAHLPGARPRSFDGVLRAHVPVGRQAPECGRPQLGRARLERADGCRAGSGDSPHRACRCDPSVPVVAPRHRGALFHDSLHSHRAHARFARAGAARAERGSPPRTCSRRSGRASRSRPTTPAPSRASPPSTRCARRTSEPSGRSSGSSFSRGPSAS